MNQLQDIYDKLDKMQKGINKILRDIFCDEIKGSFLIEIKEAVLASPDIDLWKYYDPRPDLADSLSKTADKFMDHDICRMIVGLHRSNTVLLTEEEKGTLQKDREYKERLVSDVIKHIKLRNYASCLFRDTQMMEGERFLYYPLAYDLFALNIKLNRMLNGEVNKDGVMYNIIASISNKISAVLVMLEANVCNSAYPVCRGITELFVKFTVLLDAPEARAAFERFNSYSAERSLGKGYSPEFDREYAGRKADRVQKTVYVHYGWVDAVPRYHDIVKTAPYTFGGLLQYIRERGLIVPSLISNTEDFYKMCHGYAHGTLMENIRPLMSYYEISFMLTLPLTQIYMHLCRENKISTHIEGVDVLHKTYNDYNLAAEKYMKAQKFNKQSRL